MIQVIDPRPLEPDWVFDDSYNDPGELQWTSKYTRWSPWIRAEVTIRNSGSQLPALLQELETLIRSEQEAEIFVDTTSLEELEEIPPLVDWISIGCKIPSESCLFYEITINYEESRDCSDGDEALAIIEEAIYNRQIVEVSIKKQ